MRQVLELDRLFQEYMEDPRFKHLRKPGINFVPGTGPSEPTIMLVGEAPGIRENEKRSPFVGPAGVNLSNILHSVKLNPFMIYRTNIVKYWPTDETGTSRHPTEQELADSKEYLIREISIVNPRFVGLCGQYVVKTLFPDVTDMYSNNGKLLDGAYVPLYPPAVLCHSPHKWKTVRSGFYQLKRYMDNGKTKKVAS